MCMKTIGIKLADGTFYPILEEGSAQEKILDLTTAHNNQTTVMVDLYRSTNCTMDDAEYVDTLRIDNLIAHPNGEPDITFTVSLDENNKLKAKIVDTETGASSKSSITLVSRTIEERLQMDDYTISDSKLSSAKKVAAGAGVAIAGGGLLARVNAALKEKNESEQKISEPAEAQTESIENTSNNEEEFSVDDIYVEPEFDESSVIEEPSQVLEETSISEEELTNIEQTNEITEESSEIEEPAFEDATEIFEDSLDIEEETSLSEDMSVFEESTSISEDLPDFVETTSISDDLPNFEESTNISEDLPDFEESTDISDDLSDFEESTNISEDLPDFEESTDISDDLSDFEESTSISEDLPDFEESTDISDDLPNFEETTGISDDLPDFEESTTISDDLPDFEETTNISDDLPNFDDVTLTDDELSNIALTSDITEENSFSDDMPDFEEESDVLAKQGLLAHAESLLNDESADQTVVEENSGFADDFDLPDFDDIDVNESTSDDDFDSIYKDEILTTENDTLDDIPAGNGISFTGLYDKETELGISSNDEEEIKKKTKAPVVICVICALICILATVLILFVIPSKYNLIDKNSNKDSVKVEDSNLVEEKLPEPIQEEIIQEEPEPIPEAQEDEVIVIEQAEEVIPLPPPVEPEPIVEEKQDITYKIKWGDTLWDIADSYYKNPWKYHKIAKYNNIKNPDHIISGTIIKIPE